MVCVLTKGGCCNDITTSCDTNPEVHHHIANDTKDGVSIYRGWPGEDLRDSNRAYRVISRLASKLNLTHRLWEPRTLFLGCWTTFLGDYSAASMMVTKHPLHLRNGRLWALKTDFFTNTKFYASIILHTTCAESKTR